jgi:hypothetical protein
MTLPSCVVGRKLDDDDTRPGIICSVANSVKGTLIAPWPNDRREVEKNEARLLISGPPTACPYGVALLWRYVTAMEGTWYFRTQTAEAASPKAEGGGYASLLIRPLLRCGF